MKTATDTLHNLKLFQTTRFKPRGFFFVRAQQSSVIEPAMEQRTLWHPLRARNFQNRSLRLIKVSIALLKQGNRGSRYKPFSNTWQSVPDN